MAKPLSNQSACEVAITYGFFIWEGPSIKNLYVGWQLHKDSVCGVAIKLGFYNV